MDRGTETTQRRGNSDGPVMGGINLAAYRLEFDAREAARRIYAPYQAGGKEPVFDFMARLCNLSRHKAKALGMREEHIYQRHADGSYSLKILMIPEAGASDIGGVDGIIIHRTRGIVGHETGEGQ